MSMYQVKAPWIWPPSGAPASLLRRTRKPGTSRPIAGQKAALPRSRPRMTASDEKAVWQKRRGMTGPVQVRHGISSTNNEPKKDPCRRGQGSCRGRPQTTRRSMARHPSPATRKRNDDTRRDNVTRPLFPTRSERQDLSNGKTDRGTKGKSLFDSPLVHLAQTRKHHDARRMPGTHGILISIKRRH